MPLSDHARWRVALRAVGAVVAVASAAVAVWLIARGNDSKTVQIGVIVGLWAALLGSATVFGTRRGPAAGDGGMRRADLDRVVEASTLSARAAAREAAAAAAEQAADAAARKAVAAVQEANAGRELERRRTAEVESERDEATRREFALSLELMLRREMERVLREELDSLRQEVAGLRNDLTEKVPGQIRLERIETTRLIGSDLEALQAEVRRLAQERVALGGPPVPAITLSSIPTDVRPAEPRIAEPVTVDASADAARIDPLEPAPPVTLHGDTARIVAVPPARPVPNPPAAPAAAAEPVAPAASAAPSPVAPAPAARVAAAPTPVAPAPSTVPDVPAAAWSSPTVSPMSPPAAPPAPSAPAAAATASDAPTAEAPASGSPVREVDPFAGLPRLSRWVDPYEGEPEPAPAAPTPPRIGAPTSGGGHTAPASDDAPTPSGEPEAVDPATRYVGRRRQADGDAADVVQVVPDPEPAPEPRPEPVAAPAPSPTAAPAAEATGRRHAREEPPTEHERSGGRRRRRDDEPGRGGHSRPELVPDDVLARLLGR